MGKTFTTEEFSGYEFICTSSSANVGFKHICKVLNNNGEEVKNATSIINWGNRTWEAYQYASVFEESKRKLRRILEDNTNDKEEIDTYFLNILANHMYINDYAEDESGETYILVDSWKDVEENSVWDKLVKLAKDNKLKPSINYTMLALENNYVCTDVYTKCYECGKLLNISYGEGTLIEGGWYCGYYCNDCVNSNDEIVGILIEEAKDNFKKAIPVEAISNEKLEELGYKAIADMKDFSFCSDNWTADLHISLEEAEKVCEKFNGFAKLSNVQQFDTLFYIYVPVDKVEEANQFIGYNED